MVGARGSHAYYILTKRKVVLMTPKNRRGFIKDFRALTAPQQLEVLGLMRDFANIYRARREAEARRLE